MPDAILNKSSRLTDAETDVMRQHTLWGKKILAGLEFLPQADLGASYHHERYDGTGYPAGLMGEDLPAWCGSLPQPTPGRHELQSLLPQALRPRLHPL